MTREVFTEQMTRLKATYGEKSYPEERAKLLWRTFSTVRDEVFIQALDFLIMSKRSTPLHVEFHDAISEATQAINKNLYSIPGNSLLEQLEYAADHTEDPGVREYAKEVCRLVGEKVTGKLSPKQWQEALGFMDGIADGITKRKAAERKISQNRTICLECCDSGYTTVRNEEGYACLYRCSCSAGSQRSPTALGPRRQDEEREEIIIPQLKRSL